MKTHKISNIIFYNTEKKRSPLLTNFLNSCSNGYASPKIYIMNYNFFLEAIFVPFNLE